MRTIMPPLDERHLAIEDRNRAERELGILYVKKNRAEDLRQWAEYDRLHFAIHQIWEPRRFEATQRLIGLAKNRSVSHDRAA